LKERAFWNLVNVNLQNLHIQRIETGGTGRGIPDFNACCEGVEFWVELKVVNSGNKIGLRPEQAGWLLKRAKHGGKCFVLVRTPKAEIYLYKGEQSREIIDNGLKEKPVLILTKPYEWEKLINSFTFTED
jgi:Holliday junction resolvase|tara:strand:- start:883 stop:1272 length:390 start_codon:yes stop_codon:yes gene_type:complete